MKKLINGKYVDLTAEETVKAEAAEVSYDEAVDAQIRRRYTASQEFAILRQKDEKPAEYDAYYAYCEECKLQVKEQYHVE